MKTSNLHFFLATLITFGMSTSVIGQGEGWGYVWADNPSASSYTPNSSYSYNSSGKSIRINRVSTGVYKVQFRGLGGNNKAGGNVQVTAYGDGTEVCKVVNWQSGGADFNVTVRCFNNNEPVDTHYSLRVDWPSSAIQQGRLDIGKVRRVKRSAGKADQVSANDIDAVWGQIDELINKVNQLTEHSHK